MLTVMTTRISTMDQVRAFLEGTKEMDFEVPSQAERHRWIVQSLGQLAYERLVKKERGLVSYDRKLCSGVR